MKNRNWFWGIFFLLSGVFIIGSQTGSFGQIGVLSVLATIFLVALAIHSLINFEFFGMFVPIAFLYLIYQKPFNLVEISSWVLIMSAILISIGFNIIFHNNKAYKYKHKDCRYHGEYSKTSENIDDNNPFTKVSFGSSSKYLHADCLKSGKFIMSFGELEVYFDQVQLSPDGAEILVDCSFGEIKLFVPKRWQVIENIHTSLGSVENDNRMARPEENAPKLIITGSVQFGSVEIHYI